MPGLIPVVRNGVQLFSCITVCHLGICQDIGLPGGMKDEHDLASENFRLLYSIVGEEMQKAKCGPEAVLKAGFFLV